jgi:hypothetical protein
MRVGGQSQAPASLPPVKRSGTHFIGGWLGLRAGLNGCRKSCPHRDSIPGTSRPHRFVIPTILSRPSMYPSLRNLRMPTATGQRTVLFNDAISRSDYIASVVEKWKVCVCACMRPRAWNSGETIKRYWLGVNECTRRKPCPVATIYNTNTAKLTGLGSSRDSAVWTLMGEVINLNISINLLSTLVERRRKELRSTDLKTGKQK